MDDYSTALSSWNGYFHASEFVSVTVPVSAITSVQIYSVIQKPLRGFIYANVAGNDGAAFSCWLLAIG
jgi:hypothetical protein